ncbi:SHOCT domain-containing protein [Streptomyces cynarae]|uniref:SHOCT domain-containing protein n=1 Tax=Streptomyces cynarae TaxID=2981134 RepID=UPI00406C4550
MARRREVIGVMWYDGGWGWGGWFVMTAIMILFWALLIAGVVALVHYFTRGQHSHRSGRPLASPPGQGSHRAEDVLAERFARGEIDDDEYKRRLTLLREHR